MPHADATVIKSEGGFCMDDQNGAMPQGQATTTQGAATAPKQEESMIPKWRFDEVNQSYKTANDKVVDLMKQLEAVKDKDTKIAELEKQIKDMQANYDLEKSNSKKMAAIEAAIADKTVDPDVVKTLLDLEKISIDDKGTVTGLEEQVKALQTSKPYLWKKAVPVAPKAGTTATKPEKSFATLMAEKRAEALKVASKSKNYF